MTGEQREALREQREALREQREALREQREALKEQREALSRWIHAASRKVCVFFSKWTRAELVTLHRCMHHELGPRGQGSLHIGVCATNSVPGGKGSLHALAYAIRDVCGCVCETITRP